MARLTSSISLAALLGAGAPIMRAQAPLPTAFHGSLGELRGRTFANDPLVISISDFQTYFSELGLRFRVLNASDSPAPLVWTDFALVGADGAQPSASDPQGVHASFQEDIVPGAHLDRFLLFSSLKYPVKLYYKGRLLAEFTK